MNIRIIITSALWLLVIATGSGQQKLFDKYADIDSVQSVYISKAMFQMIPAISDMGLSLTNLTGKLESLQLVSSNRAGLSTQMRKDFSQLVTKSHSELMRIRNGRSRVNVYSEGNGEQLKALLLLIDSDTAFTVMQILGNFTMKDIQSFAAEAGN
ncbi:MAG: DUF4252 domain-containing protein [Tannerellaceae bacterium]|jgi:hypothetical protein|nr:DUF4252 domain-containing protein [Tannerellaceae bacterium]